MFDKYTNKKQNLTVYFKMDSLIIHFSLVVELNDNLFHLPLTNLPDFLLKIFFPTNLSSPAQQPASFSDILRFSLLWTYPKEDKCFVRISYTSLTMHNLSNSGTLSNLLLLPADVHQKSISLTVSCSPFTSYTKIDIMFSKV